ncbi:DUF2431 domain-containing protein, partial [Aliiglaciecola sp.]|nr:DUF2431 domain-containing protein [Aliiglaciecola sp.]
GDGDLSFSACLAESLDKDMLVASTLDNKETIYNKYSINAVDQLEHKGVAIKFGLDICDSTSFDPTLKHDFDVIIFQFPLIPTHKDLLDYKQASRWGGNVLNRRLLWHFLHHAFSYFLSPRGRQLAMITSKDVKPYSHWNIENLYQSSNYKFLGYQNFDIDEFTGYRLRNVDRDKEVKNTASKTYLWGANIPSEFTGVLPSPKHKQNYCCLCGKGPFNDESDRLAHQNSRGHKRLQHYEEAWRSAIKKGLLNE